MKTLKKSLVGLLIGASSFGLGVVGYNYLKNDELIPTPSVITSVETQSKTQSDYVVSNNKDKQSYQSVSEQEKTEQKSETKQGTSKPLPKPFEPDEKYLSEEHQKKVRELSDEKMRRNKDYINSQNKNKTSIPVTEDSIVIRNTDNDNNEPVNLEEAVKKVFGPGARVVEHKVGEERAEGNIGGQRKQKDKTESENKLSSPQPYPLDILDLINKSGRMPTKDYKNDKFEFGDKDGNVTFSYYSTLLDVLGGSKTPRRAEDNPKKGEVIIDEKGRKFVALDKVVVEYDVYPSTIVASYKDINENGVMEHGEITEKNDFYLKDDKKLVLGIYIPKPEKAKKGTIELYDPGFEKVLESNFEIDEDEETGEFNMGRFVELESLVKKHGVGVYTAVFYVNDKCWEVNQVGVGFGN